jgi:hypothetical protein
MTICEPEIFGADPVNIRWTVVRGDTATLRVEFYETDEETYLDISEWVFSATAFNRREEIFDELDIEVYDGYVDIVASPDITETWGTGVGGRVFELAFDLQVEVENRIWTPVLGSISVLGDVTGGTL